MGLFERFKRLLTTGGKASDASYWVTVRCNRCGEQVRTRVDLRNDLTIQYGEGESPSGYYCRKILMGEGRCFQQIEVELHFDAKRNLVDRQIQGGQFIEP